MLKMITARNTHTQAREWAKIVDTRANITVTIASRSVLQMKRHPSVSHGKLRILNSDGQCPGSQILGLNHNQNTVATY